MANQYMKLPPDRRTARPIIIEPLENLQPGLCDGFKDGADAALALLFSGAKESRMAVNNGIDKCFDQTDNRHKHSNELRAYYAQKGCGMLAALMTYDKKQREHNDDD